MDNYVEQNMIFLGNLNIQQRNTENYELAKQATRMQIAPTYIIMVSTRRRISGTRFTDRRGIFQVFRIDIVLVLPASCPVHNHKRERNLICIGLRQRATRPWTYPKKSG